MKQCVYCGNVFDTDATSCPICHEYDGLEEINEEEELEEWKS